MIAHVVTYTTVDEFDTNYEVDILCTKRDGTMPAVFSDKIDAEHLACHLGAMFPDTRYNVREVEL